ncbi:MAG TPA: 4Fe-4S dicluster domain-containing protein [Thermodesulfobacteriota bacterium]|nr:4Fe-4S dicluster domain-containing protein [Thermodesulfobacteriota bacterium]
MISVDEKICTGCRTCEFACAFQQKKSFHYHFSLIRIRKKKGEEGFFDVAQCRHCAEPPCLPECPGEAISKDPRSGVVAIDASACTGCGKCVEACPWQAPVLTTDSGLAKICDLCKGDPLCVKFCQPGALRIEEKR